MFVVLIRESSAGLPNTPAARGLIAGLGDIGLKAELVKIWYPNHSAFTKVSAAAVSSKISVARGLIAKSVGVS